MKPSLFLSVLVLLAGGCARQETVIPMETLPSVRVRLSAVRVDQAPLLTEVYGTVRPVRRAVLAAKVMGSISALPVALGQRVAADEVLITLAADDFAARVIQARSSLNSVRRDLERETDLLAKGASTAETVRTLQDRLTGSEAQLREAEIQLSYTELRAPFAGVIARKWAHAGDLAVPGQPLLEVEGLADFEVEASIPESLASSLSPGSTLACDVAGIRFSGTLKEISSSADATTRSIGVRIAVPAGIAVRSGQFTRVQIPGAVVRSLVVPANAVTVSGQMERVFLAGEGGRAVLRLVKTGAVRGEEMEILSGLAEGERVVVAPPAFLREGQPLEVQP